MAEGSWSKAELAASVEAYAEMQKAEREGRRLNKAQMYRDLEERFGRRNKAFERRMMNISHVVKTLGGEPVSGLLPAPNIGTRTLLVLESLVREQGILGPTTVVQPPTTSAWDSDLLDAEVAMMLKEWNSTKADVNPPAGCSRPQTISASSKVYERSPEVKAWVLKESGYNCECCGAPAPFAKEDGLPYLEVHHVVTLSEGGPDTVYNTVALCPNCHRAVHYSANRRNLIEQLYASVARLRAP